MIGEARGFSLVEVMAGMGLLVLLILGLSVFNLSVSKTMLRARQIHDRQNSGDSFEKMVMHSIFSVNPLKFDPRSTYYLNPAAPEGVSLVGLRWTFTKFNGVVVNYTADNLPTFTIGGNTLRNDSSLIEVYRLNKDAAGVVSKSTVAAVFSRCVDARTFDSRVITAGAALALPRPVIQTPTSTRPAGYYCCSAAGACSALNPLEQWPTTFYYASDGALLIWPERPLRPTLPGLGFSLTFDKTQPSSYSLRMIKLLNRCETSGTKAQGEVCANTAELTDSTLNFVRDIVVQVKEVIKPVASEVNGSAYINVGNAIYE